MVFAAGVLIAVLVGAVLMEETPILWYLYFGIALAEAATAIALALCLGAKYSHYDCP